MLARFGSRSEKRVMVAVDCGVTLGRCEEWLCERREIGDAFVESWCLFVFEKVREGTRSLVRLPEVTVTIIAFIGVHIEHMINEGKWKV